MRSLQDFSGEVLKDKDIPVFNEATHHEDISFHIVVWPTLLTLSTMVIFVMQNLMLILDYACFRSVQDRRISERNCKQNTTQSAFFLFSVAYKT
jgi:hypothetical protein